MTPPSFQSPERQEKSSVVICSGDFISGVTSWAFRLRNVFASHPNIRVLVINCLNAAQTVGRFDAITPTADSFKAFIAPLRNAIVVPNYFWELYPVCQDLIESGHPLSLLGYCRADSENEYYRPLQIVAPWLSRIVAVSPRCASKLSDYLHPEHPVPITTLPTGIDVPARLARDWQTTPLRIAYGGRIDQLQKRVFDLVPLVESMYRKQIDFILSIAGAGRQMAALEEQLKPVDPDRRVQALGRLAPERMPNFWTQNDLMLSLSAYEGTSNSMLEAMAAGCVPCVSKTQSGIDGVIESGANGFTFPIGDIEALTDVIASLDPSSLAALGTSAHARAREFSMEKHAAAFERIVISLNPDLVPIQPWLPEDRRESCQARANPPPP